MTIVDVPCVDVPCVETHYKQIRVAVCMLYDA